MEEKPKGIVLQKKHIVLIIVLLLVLLGAAVFGVIYGISGRNRSEPASAAGSQETAQSAAADSQKPDLVIDQNAGDWTGELPENKGGDTGGGEGIQIPGYPSITVQKDAENVRMALLNPEGNPCYFRFEIVLRESGETIFLSDYVPPGKVISDVKLKHGLKEGQYPAVIKITTISLDGVTPLNGANVETVLIAK